MSRPANVSPMTHRRRAPRSATETPPADIQLRRVYEAATPNPGGHRVLVDRLWPRGLTKAEAALDEWLKDVAPSTELRRWYDHDTDRFEEFARRYRAELRRPPASDAIEHLLQLARTGPITLLTATKDVPHSGAEVLRAVLST
jgi:uncharacterized protein YeaO (DUF488 family)